LLSVVLFVSLDLLIKHTFDWLPVITPTPMLHDIKSIAFMLAEALFIARGVYFIRVYGLKKQYVFELVIGIVMAITSFTMLYTTKHLANKWIDDMRMDLNLSAPIEAQQMAASNIYMLKGEIVNISNGKFKPTKYDVEMRENYLEINRNMKIITQGMYNVLIVVISSILFGLFSPLFKEEEKKDILKHKCV
jgi:ABC-type nickel/cobalt efflux system permease component RcnA